jgi:hypothetical protein
MNAVEWTKIQYAVEHKAESTQNNMIELATGAVKCPSVHEMSAM